MSDRKGLLDQAERGDFTKFSKLEASLAQTEVAQRPNSKAQNDVNHHAVSSDLFVNELNFNYDLDTDHYPLGDIRSLQQVFDAVQYHRHLEKEENFSLETRVECLKVDSQGGGWSILNENGLNTLLQPFSVKSSPLPINNSPGRNMLVFLLPLVPTKNTSYGSRISMTRDSVNQLMKTLDVNPLFLLNMIGRLDYWAPQTRWVADDDGRLLACDLFCQHSRWNLHVRSAPLSVYMRHDITRDLTTYIISHTEFDTSITTLKSLLGIALNTASTAHKPAVFLDDPFDIHVILSTLSFESSKFHFGRFQRFMCAHINKVEDHLDGFVTGDQAKLGDLTKQLQIISQNSDAHIGNADVAIITATAIQNAHSRLVPLLPRSSPFIYQRADGSISYVIASMEKQKMWFLNYKQRKDSIMSLFYNLVTQQDAANNIQIAHSMKQDSTSMNAIAALTMVFLPGTFAGTLVGAGVFGGAITGAKAWWVWAGITVPLTVLVMICWLLYRNTKKPMINASWVGKKGGSDSATDRAASYKRRSSKFSSGFSFRGQGKKGRHRRGYLNA